MKRKDYQKPAAKVVEVRQRQQLLAGSLSSSTTATMETQWVEEDI